MKNTPSTETDKLLEPGPDPLRVAFNQLQPGMDVSRPVMEVLLRRPVRQPRSTIGHQFRPYWVPAAITSALLLTWSFRSHQPPASELPMFASTLEWVAPTDLFGPVLSGSSSDWLTSTGSDWAFEYSKKGASP